VGRWILASHDLEDFVAVFNGRNTILEEIAESPGDVREYLAERQEVF
jgi:hypothetical protein